MNSDDILRQFEEAEARARSLKEQYAQCAQYFGQIESVLNSTKPYWVNVALQPNDTAVPVITSGSGYLTQLNQSLERVETSFPSPITDLRSIAVSSVTFGSHTIATSSFFPEPKGPLHFDVSLVPTADYMAVTALPGRFEKIDPSLASVAKQTWECLYGTVSEPERSALFMMRQTWDHLFGAIAPDAAVRDSEFFIEKEGEKPDMVTREDRLRYAIETRISDSEDQARLLAATNLMLDLYKELNRAHKRGEMNRQKAVKSLHALYDWLFLWADALEKMA
jgi:hypothetical protein